MRNELYPMVDITTGYFIAATYPSVSKLTSPFSGATRIHTDDFANSWRFEKCDEWDSFLVPHSSFLI